MDKLYLFAAASFLINFAAADGLLTALAEPATSTLAEVQEASGIPINFGLIEINGPKVK